MRDVLAAYRTPVWLAAVFLVLLGVFAATPDPTSGDADAAQPTSEPTPGPRECVVCPIDQRCDPASGQCMFVDHTPLPCVRTAKFDERAGFCLPEGAPPAPQPAVTSQEGNERRRRQLEPGGGQRTARQPRLPGFGNENPEDD